MLRKSQKDEIVKVPEPSPIAFDTKEKKALIGENISVEGNIRGEGDLVIEGSLKGSIELKKYHLIVGSQGHVEGEIKAGDVTVSGRVVGNITALNKISLTKDANFEGEIKSKSISVEDGAYLKASIELKQEANIKALPNIKITDENISGQSDESAFPASEASQGK